GVAAEGVDAAGVEGIDLVEVVAVDAAAAAVLDEAVVAEAADADGGVVVAPGGVECPAFAAGLVVGQHLALGVELMAAGVLGHQDRVGGAVDDLRELDAAFDQAFGRHLSTDAHGADVAGRAAGGA